MTGKPALGMSQNDATSASLDRPGSPAAGHNRRPQFVSWCSQSSNRRRERDVLSHEGRSRSVAGPGSSTHAHVRGTTKGPHLMKGVDDVHPFLRRLQCAYLLGGSGVGSHRHRHRPGGKRGGSGHWRSGDFSWPQLGTFTWPLTNVFQALRVMSERTSPQPRNECTRDSGDRHAARSAPWHPACNQESECCGSPKGFERTRSAF